jgi:two-component system sensor histidine kinase TctE
LGNEADGSGLGLSIVLEIADKHHAKVSVSDTLANHTSPGARFSVSFAPNVDNG